MYAWTSQEVLFNMLTGKKTKIRQIPIMQIEDDDDGILYLYEDALVIKKNIAGREFNRIVIDSKSSVDILFKFMLDEMEITDLRLKYTNTSLK